MGHRNVYRLDYIQDIFTVKWLAAALLVTVLCFCSRFYDAFTGQEMLLIRAFFQYTGEELLAMGKRWGLIYAAGLAVYLFITWRVYGLRYDYASRAQTMYASRLKHLLNRYGREKPEKTKENRGGRGR
mgnify:CR=1 FL=1